MEVSQCSNFEALKVIRQIRFVGPDLSSSITTPSKKERQSKSEGFIQDMDLATHSPPPEWLCGVNSVSVFYSL